MSKLKDITSKGMIWSGMMSFIQQILSLIFSIIIARRLTPSDFGMVGMLSIFSAIAMCLQDGGLVWALTNKKKVSRLEYSSVFWFNLLFSCVIYAVLFVCAPIIAYYFGKPELKWLSRYIFLSIIFSSLGVVQTAVLFKQVKAKERAISTLVAVALAGTTGITMAYNGFSYWGIATQSILNIGISSLCLWFYSPFRPKFGIDWLFLRDIIPIGAKFVIPNIFSIAGSNVFSIILGKQYTIGDVGNYTQASKWNTAGYSSILGMMRGVTQPILVQVRDDKSQLLKVYRKLFKMTAFLIVPTMFLLGMVATDFIEVILTSKWGESAIILRTLCFGGCFSVLCTIETYYLMSIQRTTLYMYLGIFISILLILTALVASPWGAEGLAYAYSLSNLIYFIIVYVYVKESSGYNIPMIIHDLFPIFALTALAITIGYLIGLRIENIFLRLVTKILLSGLIYCMLMNLIKCDSYLEVKQFIKKKF